MKVVIRIVKLSANPCNIGKQILMDIIIEGLGSSDLIIDRGVES